MHLKAADDEFAAEAGHDILAAAELDEVPAVGETLQRRAELLSIFALGSELTRKVLERGSTVRRTAQMAQEIVIGNRACAICHGYIIDAGAFSPC